MPAFSLEAEAEMNMQTQILNTKHEPAAPDFRDAMALLGAAVNVVTTDGAAGRAGFTASAVCSVTDQPPTLLVCLNRQASVYPQVKENRVLCVNVLADGHQDLSSLFGGKTPNEERFAAASWSVLETGSPALDGAVVSVDCRIREVVAVSTHDLLICEVAAIRHGGGKRGLVYFARRYHGLPAEGTP
jgi:flavin reductase